MNWVYRKFGVDSLKNIILPTIFNANSIQG